MSFQNLKWSQTLAPLRPGSLMTTMLISLDSSLKFDKDGLRLWGRPSEELDAIEVLISFIHSFKHGCIVNYPFTNCSLFNGDGTYHAYVCLHSYERSQILYQQLYRIDLTYQNAGDEYCAIRCWSFHTDNVFQSIDNAVYIHKIPNFRMNFSSLSVWSVQYRNIIHDHNIYKRLYKQIQMFMSTTNMCLV